MDLVIKARCLPHGLSPQAEFEFMMLMVLLGESCVGWSFLNQKKKTTKMFMMAGPLINQKLANYGIYYKLKQRKHRISARQQNR